MDRRALHQLMPRNAEDVEAARNLVSLGAAELGPVIPEMLRQLKNVDSPICNIYAEFFAREGEHYAEEIASHLSRSTMPEVKWVIVSKILPTWSMQGVQRLHGTLGMLLTAPDFFGTDLLCIKLLARHELLERSALESWLEFKQRRLRILSEMAEEVAKDMGLSREL